MRFDFLYTFCLKHFLFQEELGEMCSKLYIGLHVMCLLFSVKHSTQTFLIPRRSERDIIQTVYWSYVMCLLFSLKHSSQTFLIPRRTKRDIIQTVYRSSCNVSVIFVRF